MELLVSAVVLLLGLLAATLVVGGLDRRERWWAMLGYGAHIVSSVAHWAIYEFYLGSNDAHGYLDNGAQLARLLDVDFPRFAPQVLNVFFHRDTQLPFEVFGDGSSSGTMAAIAAFWIFCTGSSLLTMNFLASWFSWFGAIQLYRFAREEFDTVSRPLVLFGCIGVPSVVFWSSGYCKEAFVVGFFGVLTLSTYRLLRGRGSVYLAGVVGGGVGVALLKPYTLFAFLPALAAFIYSERVWRAATRVVVRPAYLALAVVIGLGGILLMGKVFPEFGADQVFTTIATQQETLRVASETGVGAGGSDVEIGSGEARTGWGQLKFAPLAVTNAFFRPIVFEARNGPMLGAALENTVFTIFLLQLVFGKTRALVPGIVARSPFLFSAVVFCGVFGLGVGLATANLGTMSRYRAPMMPFYVTTLLILRQRGRQTLELEERGRIRVRAGRGRLA